MGEADNTFAGGIFLLPVSVKALWILLKRVHFAFE